MNRDFSAVFAKSSTTEHTDVANLLTEDTHSLLDKDFRDLPSSSCRDIRGSVFGQDFWRTLEEQAHDPAFQARLYNEFPSELEAITDPVARRTFLKLMGASLGLAGITACTRQPDEKIFPYVQQPEQLVLGKPLFYATAMTIGGVATGLLVESHEGRPTKIEGNPAVGGFPRRDPRRHNRTTTARRRRHQDSHRVGLVADTRLPNPRRVEAVPGCEVAPVGSCEP
jgi:MoCo/4Fe-4S cofactor protein with predicted Tat translocation signal